MTSLEFKVAGEVFGELTQGVETSILVADKIAVVSIEYKKKVKANLIKLLKRLRQRSIGSLDSAHDLINEELRLSKQLFATYSDVVGVSQEAISKDLIDDSISPIRRQLVIRTNNHHVEELYLNTALLDLLLKVKAALKPKDPISQFIQKYGRKPFKGDISIMEYYIMEANGAEWKKASNRRTFLRNEGYLNATFIDWSHKPESPASFGNEVENWAAASSTRKNHDTKEQVIYLIELVGNLDALKLSKKELLSN